jgi:poly(A) polymerase/tRNA nucleotidyltransferase (CCA-adding enzyme)
MISVPGVEILWDALPEARVVGGAVRDSLLSRASADVDFAVPLSPEVVMARLKRDGIKCVPTGLAHGTVTAVVGGRGFEITSLRRDEATDGRHAVVAFTDDWREDASRRDFTINAMSVSRDGTLFDYFGGRDDLAAGRVRFVGEAARRITEDFLRILRFFRFYARYGGGAPDAEAVTAITALRDGLRQLSVERVWSEIKLILLAEYPRAALTLMRDTGVLPLILPGAVLERFDALVARGAPVEPLLRVAALTAEDAGALAARLKLSGEELAGLLAMQKPNRLRPDLGEADLRRALAGEDYRILIARTWLAQDETPGWDGLRARIAAMPRPVFPLQGRDVAAAGFPPGPEIGRILADIQGWWMDGGCVADADACRARIPKLANSSAEEDSRFRGNDGVREGGL